MWIFSVYSDNNIIISYTTLSRRSEGNRGLSTHQTNIDTSQSPLVADLISLPLDDVALSKVSTVRAYFLPTPHNIQQRYCIFRHKPFLHPYKHFKQSNLTCLITRSTHNSCLSYKIKSSSDLYSIKFQSRSRNLASQININATMQHMFGRLHN